MNIRASAKINICLDVLKKDESGYHIIQTIFHEVKSLYDEVEILESKKDEIVINTPIAQAENLAYKALKLIKEEFGIKKCAKIIIIKNIPISSGLGGGASNAAAVLKGLNKLWKLKLSNERLLEFATRLGMDVPFFILGGTVYGEHFGEKLTPLSPIKNLKFTLFFSDTLSVLQKTAKAYEKLKLSRCGKDKNKTKKILKAIESRNLKLIIENIHNDFEITTPVSEGKHLSGAGPSTFSVKEYI